MLAGGGAVLAASSAGEAAATRAHGNWSKAGNIWRRDAAEDGDRSIPCLEHISPRWSQIAGGGVSR